MDQASIMNKVNEIFQEVFDDDSLEIKSETNSDHIEDWDSLAHINLVVAIESEFSIKFALGELEELKNVGEMIDLIEKKLA